MIRPNIVEICRIYQRIYEYALLHPTFFDVSIGESDPVVTNSDVLDELKISYMQMSFISYDDDYLTGFLQSWSLYVKRHKDEWGVIYSAYQDDMITNISADFYSNETATPNLSQSTTYGKVSTNGGTITNSLLHGHTQTTQTNTDTGVLRNNTQVSNTGTDTTTNTLADTNTLSGTDTTSTTGTNTIEKAGYYKNPFDNMQKAIDFTFRNNLRDLIINNFVREFLFYDNENGGYRYDNYTL